jgi:uncharacterized DUF497 family protein
MTQPVYQFKWDAAKARRNQTKHGVSFKLAMSVLRDPLALTVYDGITATKRSAGSRWGRLPTAKI